MANEHTVKRNFAKAKEISKQSNFERFHLGCVAVYKGSCLATGYNSLKTSPIQKRYNRFRGYNVETAFNSIHAEMMALAKIRYLDIDFSKVMLYIYREHKDGSVAKAKPCEACRAAIKDMGIKTIYYTTEDGWCEEHFEERY